MHLLLGQAVPIGPIQDVLAVAGLVLFDSNPLALFAVVMQPVTLGAVAMELTAVLCLAATRASLPCFAFQASPIAPDRCHSNFTDASSSHSGIVSRHSFRMSLQKERRASWSYSGTRLERVYMCSTYDAISAQ